MAASPGPHLCPTDLRLFTAGDSQKNVVKVGAAPPQHVHPLLTPFLPQLVDGILRAGERRRQGTKAQIGVHSARDTQLPALAQAHSHALSATWLLKSSQAWYEACGQKELEIPRVSNF